MLRGAIEICRNDLRATKKTLRLQSRTPSLLQDRTSLAAFLVELWNPGSIELATAKLPKIKNPNSECCQWVSEKGVWVEGKLGDTFGVHAGRRWRYLLNGEAR